MGFGLRSTTATFVYMTHSAVVSRFETALPLRTREKGGSRERPPPKTGGSCGPAQMAFAHASVPAPMGSLTSSFIPAGRLKKTRRRTYEMASAWPSISSFSGRTSPI